MGQYTTFTRLGMTRFAGILTLALAGAGNFLTPGTAHAEPGQSLDAIRDTVRTFLSDQREAGAADWDVRIHRLDPRLRLHPCESPLEAFAPHGRIKLEGRTTVGVRCNDSKPWKLYVPVSIDRFTQVVVVNRPLSPGQRVRQEHVSLERKNTARLPYGFFTTAADVVGLTAKHNLRPGDVVRPGTLTEPTLVKRGQELLLVADSGSVKVSMSGTALENGTKGQRIQVRNEHSERIVEGVVLDGHRVRVGTLKR